MKLLKNSMTTSRIRLLPAPTGALQILAEQQQNGNLQINPTWIDSSGDVLSAPVKTYI